MKLASSEDLCEAFSRAPEDPFIGVAFPDFLGELPPSFDVSLLAERLSFDSDGLPSGVG